METKIKFLRKNGKFKKYYKYRFNRGLENKSNNNLYNCKFKAFTIVFLLIVYIKIKIKNRNQMITMEKNGIFTRDEISKEKNNKNLGPDDAKYFSCFVAIVKKENRYIRETVEHYIKLGVEKFYFADDNVLNDEKISDVLQDYIDKGIVVVKDVRGKNMSQLGFYQLALVNLKNICKWILYYDIDEFLEFKDKNMTIKDYLSLDGFDKCEVVKIHWLMHYDNDLVYYDKRPLKERFTKPDYNSDRNNYHKSIVRVKDYNITMWVEGESSHQPNETFTYSCDATGRYYKPTKDVLGIRNYKYGYIKHFSMKTAEESAWKLLRGWHNGRKNGAKELNRSVDLFFSFNRFTEEKLSVFEKILNTTFPKYHKKSINHDIQ